MQIKCPACHTEHDLEAGKYQCWCGKYFFVYEDGNVVLIKQKRFDFKIFQKKFQAESMVTVLACVIFILLISFVVVCITGEKTIKTIFLPNGVKLDMVKIKAGSFLMGSPDDEQGRSEDETLHKVTLTRDFWIGKYEVTQAQYEAVMGKEGEKEVNDKSIPALGISWIKAKEFCDKLNELYKDKLPSGYQFDLPTEAQWEYACRAGTTTALNDGTNLTNKRDCVNLDKLAWYFKKDSLEGYPVGPKIWGTADVIDPCYTNGEGHIIRGGSFYNDPDQCRSASRASYPQEWENIAFGFRLALVSKNNGNEDTSVQQNPGKDEFSVALEKANAGDPEMEFFVAKCYFNGIYVTKNLSEYIKWIQKAAEHDHRQAQYILGLSYETGLGLRKNLKSAFYWFLKSANNGYVDAQFKMGCILLESPYEKDKERAFEWLLLASKNGHEKAKYMLEYYLSK